MSSKNKVLITFLGNLNYDTRCKNLFNTLKVNGYEVEFLGFDWLTKDFKPVKGDITIHKLHKGFLSLSFYLKFSWHIKISFNGIKSINNFCGGYLHTTVCSYLRKAKKSKGFL